MLYIKIHVYNDGDIELTPVDLTQDKRRQTSSENIHISLEGVMKGELTKELLDYGAEEVDVERAVIHILQAPLNESCIVGKI